MATHPRSTEDRNLPNSQYEPRSKDPAPHDLAVDFHSLFRLRVTHRALAQLLRKELEAFINGAGEADLVVEELLGRSPEHLLSTSLGDYAYDESTFSAETRYGRVEFGERLLRAAAKIPPEFLLDKWVEGFMHKAVVGRGAAFIHAAAVARANDGYVFPAWAHGGKTNLAINFLANGYDYMADDGCFLSETGEILGYPRWLNLMASNFESHPALVAALGYEAGGRDLRRRLEVIRFANSLRTSGWFPRKLRGILETRFVVNLRIPASKAVPGARTALRAPLTKACLLTASRSRECRIVELSADELARKTMMTGWAEKHMFRLHMVARAYATSGEAREDYADREREILARAFGHAQCMEVILPIDPGLRDLDRVRALIERV